SPASIPQGQATTNGRAAAARPAGPSDPQPIMGIVLPATGATAATSSSPATTNRPAPQAGGPARPPTYGGSPPRAPRAPSPPPIKQAPAQLPVTFIGNQGQWDPATRFAAQDGALAARFENDAIQLQLGGAHPASVGMTFDGASPGATVVGVGKQAGYYN